MKSWRKIRIGSNAESITQDLSREGGNLSFCEDSRRIISELGNVELLKVGKTKPTWENSLFESFLSVATQIFKWVPWRSEKIVRKLCKRAFVCEKNKGEGRLSPQRIEIGKEFFFCEESSVSASTWSQNWWNSDEWQESRWRKHQWWQSG